jgi:hypothetical protein
MTKKEWSHLPNAEHIDWVLETLANDSVMWEVAWDDKWLFAWDAAENAAQNASLSSLKTAEWHAAWRAGWDAVEGDEWRAVWGSIAALIAWDNSAELLDMLVEEVEALANEGNHAAVLLLPAVIVKHKLKGMK